MSVLNEYTELKRKVEEAKQKAGKAEGALEQVMKELKSKFGCSTLKEAVTKLTLLQKQEKKLNTDFEDAIEAFEDKWDDGL